MNNQDQKKLPPNINIGVTCKNCYLRDACERYQYNKEKLAPNTMREINQQLSKRDLNLVHIVIANDCKYYRMDFGIIIKIIWHKAKKTGIKVISGIKTIKKLAKELHNGV